MKNKTGKTLCQRKKCGEFNMLKCAKDDGHKDDHCFVVDHENDYPWNKTPKANQNKRRKGNVSASFGRRPSVYDSCM